MIIISCDLIDLLIKHSAFKLATSKVLSSYWIIKVGTLFTYLSICQISSFDVSFFDTNKETFFLSSMKSLKLIIGKN